MVLLKTLTSKLQAIKLDYGGRYAVSEVYKASTGDLFLRLPEASNDAQVDVILAQERAKLESFFGASFVSLTMPNQTDISYYQPPNYSSYPISYVIISGSSYVRYTFNPGGSVSSGPGISTSQVMLAILRVDPNTEVDDEYVDGQRQYLFSSNKLPTLQLSTTNARTLYENDSYNITGNAKDVDIGDIVSVKYSLNGGSSRAISTAISSGADIPFSKVLTFKNKRLYDGAASITADLAEGTQHTLRVWAEDDKGGRSQDVVRTFQVVANRAPILTVQPIADASNLIDSDTITFSGSVSDPDGNSVTVEQRVGGGSFAQIYSGNGGSFTFNVQLKNLKVGANPITVRATDSYGAVTTRNLSVTKSGVSAPLKESVQRYKITPPNVSAQGVILWIERDTGDLIVSAEISMTGSAEDEAFVPMSLKSTAFVGATREEDEFQFEGVAPKEKIIIKLTMKRANTESPQAIRLVSGVLS